MKTALIWKAHSLDLFVFNVLFKITSWYNVPGEVRREEKDDYRKTKLTVYDGLNFWWVWAELWKIPVPSMSYDLF